jgi:6-pyruvoyltetrahydropterin/6-carboxytetrahydropterin synthase
MADPMIFLTGSFAVTAAVSVSSMNRVSAMNAGNLTRKATGQTDVSIYRPGEAMFELKIVTDFSAAHQLREFKGACERLHGHNWRIEVCVVGKDVDETGVVVDFKILKEHVNDILDDLDHRFLNDLAAFQSRNPSSENIARYIAEQLDERLEMPDVQVSRVTAWESDDACATYYPRRRN